MTNCQENQWPVFNKKLLNKARKRLNKCFKAATAQALSPITATIRIIPCQNEFVLEAKSDSCN